MPRVTASAPESEPDRVREPRMVAIEGSRRAAELAVVAATSQGGNGEVVDPCGVKPDFERILVVPWLTAGSGKAADVCDRFDAIRCEDGEELGQRTGGMSHGRHTVRVMSRNLVQFTAYGDRPVSESSFRSVAHFCL